MLLGMNIAELVVVLLLAVILGFEVWMFIDVINNSVISKDRRLLWLAGMILIHPFVAIVYYYTDRQTVK